MEGDIAEVIISQSIFNGGGGECTAHGIGSNITPKYSTDYQYDPISRKKHVKITSRQIIGEWYLLIGGGGGSYIFAGFARIMNPCPNSRGGGGCSCTLCIKKKKKKKKSLARISQNIKVRIIAQIRQNIAKILT